ncbi:MAG: glycosyltransferase [Thermoleophilaceae bacterium]|nr:glycosyltransferase [Thermoleophilaceae bacterium]
MSGLRFRAVAVVTLAASIVWLPFAAGHVNGDALWLAVPFLLANLLLTLGLGVALVNNWSRSVPPAYTVTEGSEPVVAVIVPTAGESPEHVGPTVKSVLRQDWPAERLVILVSDDAGSDEMRASVEALAERHPAARIHYHRPPPRESEERRGAAKSGNLNSALERLRELAPDAGFIETRDADDLVGDAYFLRRCVGHLIRDPRTAYVQTAKEARVSPGDPFDNIQPLFFRGAMLARHDANAVFPCGSGLVWRRAALEDIGGFPTWNLVEDVQSGVEALRRGWRSAYVPILGALGQHSPEDLANVYKQRGTWALDTVRLLVWGNLRGLNLRQRLQFAELGLFYVQSFATLVFVACPAIGFAAGVYPLNTDYGDYALHFWPFAIAVELYFAALAVGVGYERVWRARVLWTGLAPVYMKACALAVIGGRRRKPVYRVTRKHDEHRWYWRLVLPQMALLAVLVGSMAVALTRDDPVHDLDLGSLYWAALFTFTLGCFIPRSWFRVDVRARLAAFVSRSTPGLARPDLSREVVVVMPACESPEAMERAVVSAQAVLQRVGRSARLLVVDRGALDGSADVARRLAARLPGISVIRTDRRGPGRAYRAGFDAALGSGAELVLQMDPGRGHDPGDIIRLIEAAGEADVAIASRWVDGASAGRTHALGRWMERRGSAYVRARLGVHTRDVLSGLVCFRAEALASLVPRSTPRSAALLNLDLIRAAEQRGLSVAEVPASMDAEAGTLDRPLARLLGTVVRLWLRSPGQPVPRPPEHEDEAVHGQSGRFARGPAAPAPTRIGVD